MKKTFLNLALLTAILLVNACTDDSSELIQISNEMDDATAEAYVDFVEDDVNELTIDLMDDLRLNQVGGVANTGNERFRPFAGRLTCADIALNIDQGTLVIDFGEGCTSSDGITRSGKINISFTDARHVAGAVITTTFEDFEVNGNKVEGIRTLTNISDGTESQRAFEVGVENGKITFEDGSARTFGGTRTKVWDIEETTREVTLTVTEDIAGTNRNGIAFSKTTSIPVVFKRSCKAVGVKVAIAGERTLTKNTDTVVINYGEGECDNIVHITRPNGEVIEISVARRRG